MAYRVLPFTVTIPANTPVASPYVQAINLDGWQLVRLDLDVPPGPAGLMGFQVYNNGVPWIPYGSGQWIIWDDVTESYYLDDQPNAGGWEIRGYNTDAVYSHAVTVRCHVNPAVTATPAPAPAVVSIATTQAASNEIVAA